ncbi:MAG: EamA family transporter [Eubacteriales bacterium]
MWILFAFLSALFAGVTSVLAKCGIRKTDSTVATAIRTGIVLLMSFVMTLIVGSLGSISGISARSWLFLALSGIATGASWLCYFKALRDGDINKVVPIDKSSTVLTVILAVIFLQEKITLLKVLCILLIAVGTYLMIEKKKNADRGDTVKGRSYLLYAFLSAIFAALTSILGKVGIQDVESNLGTMIRTAVVLIMAWFTVFVTGKAGKVPKVPASELGFICLSGLATGASWLCYYKALRDGPASIVVPIDKLSILVTVAFSYFVFREKLTKKSALGLLLIVAGTLGMLITA